MEAKSRNTVDADEVAKFSRIADEWWDPHGKFKPLHVIGPLRVQWIVDQLTGYDAKMPGCEDAMSSSPPLKGVNLLDIGCGGGLISEPMARLGATVTGIDASEKNIKVAGLHAQRSGLAIDYRCTTAEDMLQDVKRRGCEEAKISSHPLFDVVLALEIVEHVADVDMFVAACAALVKPGGLLIMSTLNRTAKSYALAILGAEYLLRWLPRGTHDWNKFLKPHELVNALRRHGVETTDMTGMVMSPLTFEWRLDAKDLGVNYLLAGKKC